VAAVAGHAVSSIAGYAYTLLFAAGGALLLTASRGLVRSVRQEAFIGVLYVVATAATILVVDRSPQGAEHVKKMLEDQKLENVFLRMGVKGGGCSGLSYSLEFDSELGKHDKKFEVDGVTVVCDAKSYLYLNGTTLDYVTEGLQGGFTFINPQAKSSCGCGTSFTA
jgi:iron-sulfur cluster assembly protein